MIKKLTVRRRAVGFLAAALAATTIAVSCATVNELDKHDFRGATLAGEMQQPPPLTIDMNYNVRIDSDNPVGTALSIGTNLAKASVAKDLNKRLDAALSDVDIPQIVYDDAYNGCVQALRVTPVQRADRADYLFDLEVREYGVRASSYGSAVWLEMEVTARIYDERARELIWRRRIDVEQRVSPYVFGLPDVVGEFVTIGILSELNEEQLTDGFTRLAEQTGREIASILKRDLYRPR